MLRMLRRLFLNPRWSTPTDLSGRCLLVTGASPGSIGFETARTLASWGASTVITTRSNPAETVSQLRERLGGKGTVEGYVLDLADRRSVADFAEQFLATHQRLDVLVNNAGVHLDLLSEWKSPKLCDGHEIHWRTNYLGTMDLTHAMLPALRDTARSVGEARVVNVVSMLHKRGSNAQLFSPRAPYNSWTAYGNSKLALVHATFELQRRHAPLQAYCLHPGAVYTRIADKGLAGHPVLGRLRRALTPIESFFLLTPEEGAQTSVHCATATGLAGGRYFSNCRAAEPAAQAMDAATSARIWDETMAWIH
ncbi:MAG: SDR family NAD(P)-dependent oxidoreductase [Sinimarinibacterium sp.]|jgi:NAD(P)-dependent dehydrogenase (short-subunit alcohol dehydrogenase family)